jgi:2-oxoglutarate dehydrogenase E2 component (dihydrolipoamide succinyltransferase)
MPTNVEIPALGESVREAVLVKWHKKDGDTVTAMEPLCELETDKANVDVPAPISGVLRRTKEEGDTVQVGETVARIDESGVAAPVKATAPSSKVSAPLKAEAPAPKTSPAPSSTKSEDLRPSVRRIVEEKKLDASVITGTGPGGRITKEDAEKHASDANGGGNELPGTVPSAPTAPAPSASRVTPGAQVSDSDAPAGSTAMHFDAKGEYRSPMTKIRKRIAERLVTAQQTAAILTTFNEIDLHNVMDIRAKFKERFEKVHGVGLGFMSFFARATVLALREFPRVNAFINGGDVIYHQNAHLGIAVSTDRGLAVPVLRNADQMSFAKIESEIKRLAQATREGKLNLEELTGGTFTITNGGIFGSLLSTPIINPPQSGILGMHAIQKRPVAVGDQVVIRPMMYVALSYDHRLVDGRESVSFLVKIKEYLEDPARLMLEI